MFPLGRKGAAVADQKTEVKGLEARAGASGASGGPTPGLPSHMGGRGGAASGRGALGFWAQYRWPAIVVGMLVCHASAIVVAVTVAVRSQDRLGVTPDYYAKALAWDATRAELRRSAAMGWSLTLTPSIWVDGDGRREVVIGVADADGEPISGATVAVKGYHGVYTDKTVEGVAMARPGGAGEYVARLAMEQAGPWRLTLRVSRGAGAGGEVFLTEVEQAVANVMVTE